MTGWTKNGSTGCPDDPFTFRRGYIQDRQGVWAHKEGTGQEQNSGTPRSASLDLLHSGGDSWREGYATNSTMSELHNIHGAAGLGRRSPTVQALGYAESHRHTAGGGGWPDYQPGCGFRRKGVNRLRVHFPAIVIMRVLPLTPRYVTQPRESFSPPPPPLDVWFASSDGLSVGGKMHHIALPVHRYMIFRAVAAFSCLSMVPAPARSPILAVLCTHAWPCFPPVLDVYIP
jgi:hypothetical protein